MTKPSVRGPNYTVQDERRVTRKMFFVFSVARELARGPLARTASELAGYTRKSLREQVSDPIVQKMNLAIRREEQLADGRRFCRREWRALLLRRRRQVGLRHGGFGR